MWIVCLVAAISCASYIAWWLLLDQTGRIDTLAAARLDQELAVPSDGVSIAQSFPVPPGGTNAVCVLVVNGTAASRKLLIQLQSDYQRQPAHVLSRVVRDVPAGTSECLGVPVPGTQSPTDATWWVALRAISAEASTGLSVRLTQGNALERGRLLIGGKERWGTLGFTLTAPQSTRWNVDWPKELYRPSRKGQLLWLICIASGLAAGALLLSVRALATTTLSAGATVVCVPLLMALLHGLSHWSPRPAPALYEGAGRALLDQLSRAEMHTTSSSLVDGFAVVNSDIRPAGDRALFALPDSAVSWQVSVTEPTSLDTAVALRQEAWTRPGDGATFTVSVAFDGHSEILWQGHVAPYADADARRWQDVTVRLDRYVGQDVTLTLATGAGASGNAVMDAAMWREPVLRRSVMR